MTPTRIRQIIGGTSVVLGAFWLGYIADAMIRSMPGVFGEGALPALTGVAGISLFLSFMAIPGILATVFGVRLFRRPSLRSLSWVIGVWCTCGVMLLWSSLIRIPESVLPSRIESPASMMMITMLALAAYVAMMRWLFPLLGADKPARSALIGRGVLCALAFELWFLLSGLSDVWFPPSAMTGSNHPLAWGMLSLFGPFVIAGSAIRLAASRFPQPMSDPFRTKAEWMTTLEPDDTVP